MYLLGIDIGTSAVKVSVIEAATQQCVGSARYPDIESEIISVKPGWAEQSPDMWWDHVKQAIARANAARTYDPKEIRAIGIAYQMHGLVMADGEGNVIRNSIIWCDSRAVETGNEAFDAIGHEKCLSHLLNSPGNFTASKFAWVKANEPEHYTKTSTIMLPGDFIAMKLTGEVTTSISALSEGVFWDFKENGISADVISQYGFNREVIPAIRPVFAEHGKLTNAVAGLLGLTAAIPVTYKAGDQPNNALSLNVLKPGEVAATAGTSGVIYGVSDHLTYDQQSRINTFAHVNHAVGADRLGVLLCINGTGILNRWTKNLFASDTGYEEMNGIGKQVAPGSDGLRVLPFGNGAERMLNNKIVGVHFQHIDLNLHTRAHMFRAVQEGIAFAFRYGLDIMRENGMVPNVIRAGRANLFLSDLFTEAFVNATNVPVELYPCDGSIGAALGAGIGAGIYASPEEAFSNSKPLSLVQPHATELYEAAYQEWKTLLERQLAIS
ncbi:xylulokinase [Hufsiella ginkgonis]|uniref:Carbohydrate kinase n=1 Tax=Hufsiella ginkgonis TaxID=2695274 RepID=A0A7K1Y331_9SPHI|nr:FGGY family carbohydrate kinase [Hufsiella ginkgonis]MXV17642.1 carbohydrate kinase [Hufsiella ginkgonis]